MADQPTDHTSEFQHRKYCTQCGASNRQTAKVCAQCGHVFKAMLLAQSPVEPRKRCPRCQKDNRLMAKICVQCGYHFKGQHRANKAHGDAGKAAKENQSQKWCPRCGQVNKLVAKVCIQCGHRFRTQFGAGRSNKVSVGGEAPITQNPEQPMTLPQEFKRVSTPELPPSVVDDPVLPKLDIPISSPAASPPPAQDILDGEPAPDISNADLDILRQQSPDNIDPYGRLKLSLQRKSKHP